MHNDDQPPQSYEVSTDELIPTLGFVAGNGVSVLFLNWVEQSQLNRMHDLQAQIPPNTLPEIGSDLDGQLFSAEYVAVLAGVCKFPFLILSAMGVAYELNELAKAYGGWRAVAHTAITFGQR